MITLLAVGPIYIYAKDVPVQFIQLSEFRLRGGMASETNVPHRCVAKQANMIIRVDATPRSRWALRVYVADLAKTLSRHWIENRDKYLHSVKLG